MNSPNYPALHVSCGDSVCALLRFVLLNYWKHIGSDTQRTGYKAQVRAQDFPLRRGVRSVVEAVCRRVARRLQAHVEYRVFEPELVVRSTVLLITFGSGN